MISIRPGAAAAVSGSAEPGTDYVASETHFAAVAGRIASSLRESPLVLVTGDPPPHSQRLLQALRTATEGRHRVLPISGDCAASIDQLLGTASASVTTELGGGVAAVTGTAEATSPVIVLNDPDALTGPQIGQICEAAREGTSGACGVVLLARTGFLARLEEPPLEWLKTAARFDFAEIGQEEAVDFLRHQLANRHLHKEEKRGVPPFALRGLAAAAALFTIGVSGVVLFQHIHASGKPAAHPSAGAKQDATAGATTVVLHTAPSDAVQAPEPVGPEANSAGAAVLPQMPPPQTPLPQTPLPKRPAPATTPSSPAPDRAPDSAPSAAEIAVLRARGDDFLKAGDITSARLFYERAAGAGDGAAALRLGATFDPGFLSRAGIRGALGDPAQASSWYRRARDLGEAAAAERLKSLKQASPGDRGAAAR